MNQTLNQQLHNLLLKLHKLGQELPQILLYLTQIAQPKLPQNLIIPLLGQMFEKIPPLLSKIEPQKLAELVKDPPSEAVPLRILVDLSSIQQLLQQISVLQLLHLTNNTIPPGSQESQEAFLRKVQEAFQGWPFETLKRYHSTLSETPLHLERQQLLQLEPHLPWEILHLVIELLKLPIEELYSFQAWLTKLPPQHIRMLIQLLQIESSTLLEIKRRIASSSSISLNASTATIPTTNDTPVPIISAPSSPLIDSMGGTGGKGKKRRAENDLQSELDMIGNGEFNMELEEPSLMIYPVDSSPLSPSMQLMASPPTTSPLSPVSPSFSLPGTTPSLRTSLTPSSPLSIPNPSNRTGLTSSLLSELDVGPFPTQPQPPTRSLSENRFQIRIARQPPAKTVYQRILKPFPSVMLLTGQDNDTNLFVEAQLLRSDNEVALPQCVDGNRVVRISNGVFATFKKLKILSTSQQQGTLFRLKFTLKRYAGTQASFEDIPTCSVISNPIEVFSHTQYLNEKQEIPGAFSDGSSNISSSASAPPPPVVTEVLPPSGPCTGGTRIVILGSNFINCPGLKVRFGDIVVPATFHEQGTLICVTPSRNRGRTPVSVTNDGINFCETQSFFLFE